MIFSSLYLLVRSLLGCLMVLARREVSKAAELLVLRHENAVLRRQISRVRYQRADRLWLAALSRLIPRHRWGEMFTVTPATLHAVPCQDVLADGTGGEPMQPGGYGRGGAGTSAPQWQPCPGGHAQVGQDQAVGGDGGLLRQTLRCGSSWARRRLGRWPSPTAGYNRCRGGRRLNMLMPSSPLSAQR